MQYNSMEIRSQQLVLAFLGFYKGPIDGIWSGDSINAKRRFECDDAFIPAAPNNGLPFANRAKLPKGCQWDKEGLLSHRGLTPEKAAELLKTQQKQTTVSLTAALEQPKRVMNKSGDGGYVEDGVAYDRKGRSLGPVGPTGNKGETGGDVGGTENAAQ